MYCPRCAKQDVDAAKFCRNCGTDLETVALALDGKLVPPAPSCDDKSLSWDAPNKGWEDRYNDPQSTEDWVRKQSAGVNFMVRGATLLGAVILAGMIILRLFGVSPWPMIIWAGVFGWMGWWGIAYLAEGLGAIMQSRNMLRRRELMGIESDSGLRAPVLYATGELRSLAEATIGSKATPRSSVTEDTTARLNK